MNLSEKLLKLRKERGWSQEELADQIPISRQAVSKWESGTAVPDTENVVRLSDLFGVSTDYLLHDSFSSDRDIPALRRREEELRREKTREMVMMLLVGLEALAFFWELVGGLIYQSHLIVLLGMTVHVCLIVAFEAWLRIWQGTEEKVLIREQRRFFYRITVWMVALYPCSALIRGVCLLWPKVTWLGRIPPFFTGDSNDVLGWIVPFSLYLPLCLLVTILLRKKPT